MANRAEFVEEMGQLLEALGPGRMAGRIVGYLLICDPENQTAAELAQALKASKGSISTTTRMLVQAGMIKRVRLPGHRCAYFRLDAHAWPEILKRKAMMIVQIEAIATRGLELMEGEPPARRARLEIMRDFYRFMGEEFPALFDRWQEHHERLTK